jgi:hypothetical protein
MTIDEDTTGGGASNDELCTTISTDEPCPMNPMDELTARSDDVDSTRRDETGGTTTELLLTILLDTSRLEL